MEKVKITREQEMALENFKHRGRTLDCFVNGDAKEVTNYKSLWKLSGEDMAKLLCGWYKVKDEFKVGDWVKRTDCELYCKVYQGFDINYHNYEKVIEPWKIALLELGRKNIELEVGDIYIDNNGICKLIDSEEYLEYYSIQDFNEGRVTKYFPHEIGIDLK